MQTARCRPHCLLSLSGFWAGAQTNFLDISKQGKWLRRAPRLLPKSPLPWLLPLVWGWGGLRGKEALEPCRDMCCSLPPTLIANKCPLYPQRTGKGREEGWGSGRQVVRAALSEEWEAYWKAGPWSLDLHINISQMERCAADPLGSSPASENAVPEEMFRCVFGGGHYSWNKGLCVFANVILPSAPGSP